MDYRPAAGRPGLFSASRNTLAGARGGDRSVKDFMSNINIKE